MSQPWPRRKCPHHLRGGLAISVTPISLQHMPQAPQVRSDVEAASMPHATPEGVVASGFRPDRQFVAGRVAEVETATTGEAEDRLDELAARRCDPLDHGFEIFRVENWKR